MALHNAYSVMLLHGREARLQTAAFLARSGLAKGKQGEQDVPTVQSDLEPLGEVLSRSSWQDDSSVIRLWSTGVGTRCRHRLGRCPILAPAELDSHRLTQ